MPTLEQFGCVQFRHWQLSNRHPNCYVILDDDTNSIVTIENFVQTEDGSVLVVGFSFTLTQPLFCVDPFDAGEYLSIKSASNPSPTSSYWPIDVIKTKAFVMPLFPNDNLDGDEVEESFAVYPLQMEDKYL